MRQAGRSRPCGPARRPAPRPAGPGWPPPASSPRPAPARRRTTAAAAEEKAHRNRAHAGGQPGQQSRGQDIPHGGLSNTGSIGSMGRRQAAGSRSRPSPSPLPGVGLFTGVAHGLVASKAWVSAGREPAASTVASAWARARAEGKRRSDSAPGRRGPLRDHLGGLLRSPARGPISALYLAQHLGVVGGGVRSRPARASHNTTPIPKMSDGIDAGAPAQSRAPGSTACP